MRYVWWIWNSACYDSYSQFKPDGSSQSLRYRNFLPIMSLIATNLSSQLVKNISIGIKRHLLSLYIYNSILIFTPKSENSDINLTVRIFLESQTYQRNYGI